MAHAPLHPTPYATVNAALRDLPAQVQGVLGAQFVAMYLSGSLALGDFDPQRSDIDIVVVTDRQLTDQQIAAIGEVHAMFDAGSSPWAGKVEAVYVPREFLRRYPPPSTPVPQVEKERALFLGQLESGWIFHCYILREHGVVLAGPDPHTLIAPVDPNEMRRAVAAIPTMWLEEARTDPSWRAWLREEAHQAFVALTLCRLLYTLDRGAVASKPAAARWAQQKLGEPWAGLIGRALAGQHGHSIIPEHVADATVALVAYMLEQVRQWELSAAKQP